MSRYYDDYLCHHGILGQKWGKKNGPPYPLDASDHSASEKKAGYTKSIKKSKSDESSPKKGFSDKQKKAIKIGAAAVATGLAAYGTYRLYKSGKLDSITSQFKGEFGNFKDIGHEESGQDRLKFCNPFYELGEAYQRNCGNCIIANELRSRGKDVEALGNDRGMTISDLGQYFTNIKSDSFTNLDEVLNPPPLRQPPTDPSKMLEYRQHFAHRSLYVQSMIERSLTSKYPDGSRGAIAFRYWQDSSTRAGHFVSWSIENGKVKFENPQRPNANLNSLFARYAYKPNSESATAIRLDNLGINKDNIHNVVGKATRGNSKLRQVPKAPKRIIRGRNFVMSTLGRKD